METLDKIKTRLAKLIKLQESAISLNSTEEADVVAIKIKNLLDQYNLTMSDAEFEEERKSLTKEKTEASYMSRIGGKWEAALISVICKYNFCRSVQTKQRESARVTFTVLGLKENVDTVLWLYRYLSDNFVNMGKRHYAVQKAGDAAFGINTRPQDTFLRSYLLGCVVGLNAKLEMEQRQLESEVGTSIILRNNEAVTEFMHQEFGENLKSGRKISVKVDSAHFLGVRDGNNVTIRKGLTGENSSKNNLLS